MMINYLILFIIGLSSGVVVAGGVFAFIAGIGIVPRFVQKTNTKKYINVYEDAITLGGIFGVISVIWKINIPIGIVGTTFFGLFTGIFIGGIAVSLAEVLDVIPILMRRVNITVGMAFFMVAIALGKMIGSLIYFIIPGFFKYKP